MAKKISGSALCFVIHRRAASARTISDWNLTLTSAVPTFDGSTIRDVVLHIRYTAREGGELLREAALKSLDTELAGLPLRRSFSAKGEFPFGVECLLAAD